MSITYSSYLKLDQILTAQLPRSDGVAVAASYESERHQHCDETRRAFVQTCLEHIPHASTSCDLSPPGGEKWAERAHKRTIDGPVHHLRL